MYADVQSLNFGELRMPLLHESFLKPQPIVHCPFRAKRVSFLAIGQ
jgi:hypothetical protein